jgi:hypothetical protein
MNQATSYLFRSTRTSQRNEVRACQQESPIEASFREARSECLRKALLLQGFIENLWRALTKTSISSTPPRGRGRILSRQQSRNSSVCFLSQHKQIGGCMSSSEEKQADKPEQDRDISLPSQSSAKADWTIHNVKLF